MNRLLCLVLALVVFAVATPPEPVAPTEPVTEPVTEPAAPVSEPAAPVTEPAAPVTEPAAPVSEPAAPVTEQFDGIDADPSVKEELTTPEQADNDATSELSVIQENEDMGEEKEEMKTDGPPGSDGPPSTNDAPDELTKTGPGYEDKGEEKEEMKTDGPPDSMGPPKEGDAPFGAPPQNGEGDMMGEKKEDMEEMGEKKEEMMGEKKEEMMGDGDHEEKHQDMQAGIQEAIKEALKEHTPEPACTPPTMEEMEIVDYKEDWDAQVADLKSGGDTSQCVNKKLADGSPWHDSAGEDYSCTKHYGAGPNFSDWYCKTEGFTYEFEGMTANEACCACGGGEWKKPNQVYNRQLQLCHYVAKTFLAQNCLKDQTHDVGEASISFTSVLCGNIEGATDVTLYNQFS